LTQIQVFRRVNAVRQREGVLVSVLCVLAATLVGLEIDSWLPLAWAAAMVPAMMLRNVLFSRMAVRDRLDGSALNRMALAGFVACGGFVLLPAWMLLHGGPELIIGGAMMLSAGGLAAVDELSVSKRMGFANLAPLVAIPAAALAVRTTDSAELQWSGALVALVGLVGAFVYLLRYSASKWSADAGLDRANHELEIARLALEDRTAQRDQAMSSFGAVAWTVDFGARTVMFSSGAEDLFGRVPTFDDFATDAPPLVHPDDMTEVVSSFRSLLVGDSPRTLSHRIVRADGSIRWIRTTGSLRSQPGSPGRQIVMMSVDITAERTRQMELAALMARATQVLEARRHLLAELVPEDAAASAAMPATLDRAESDRLASQKVGEGTQDAGAPDLAAAVNGIMDQIEARDQALVIGVREVKEARKAAEAASEAKSQFLANMSHELRTPLNAIIGFSEILIEDLEYEQRLDSASDATRVRNAARQLLGLINAILDLSRLDVGRLELANDEVSLDRLVAEAVCEAQDKAGRNSNILRVSDDCEALVVAGDGPRLQQCLAGLLDNACKFTTAGTVSVDLRSFTDPDGRDWADLSVIDTGIGIDPAQLGELFTAFMQADPSNTRRHGGTGVGLALIRRLAQAMGGDLLVSSTLGEGSRFTLRLPRLSCEIEELDLRPQEAASAGRADEVMVIDDDPVARIFGLRAASSLGLCACGAATGRAALDRMETSRPALVLLDVNLPDMSGYDVLAVMRASPRLRDVPVVVVSVEDDRRPSILAGAREHLTKPCSTAQLAAAIARFASRAPEKTPDEPATEVRENAA
jgi:signal transduction histidine kinase/ActR/RegA family two-component response regulator